ncbi:MAG: hypothetical protein ACTHJU_04075 [Sphingopyxis sp.]
MGKWLDLAREMDTGVAVSAVSAVSPPKCTNGSNCTDQTPTDKRAKELIAILDGVDRLKVMAMPRGMPPTVWRNFVTDARWLAHHGVAADALCQGWTTLDLFGISRDEQWQCLAAWIGGRRDEFNRACILLREMRGEDTRLYATQSLSGSRRWHYPDPAPADAVLPWTI